MGSAPVKIVNFQEIVDAIVNIVNFQEIIDSISLNLTPSPEKYKHTWDNYSVFLLPNVAQKIVEITTPGKSEIFRKNPAQKDVFLYLGDDGEENLTIQPERMGAYPRRTKSDRERKDYLGDHSSRN